MPRYWTQERLERWKAASTIFSLVAVPLILAYGTATLQRRLADESAQTQYVQTAIAVLREPPKASDANAKQLREWAAAIIDQYAPVKLTPEGRQALIEQQLGIGPLVAQWVDEGTHCDYLAINGDLDAADRCARRAVELARRQLRETPTH